MDRSKKGEEDNDAPSGGVLLKMKINPLMKGPVIEISANLGSLISTNKPASGTSSGVKHTNVAEIWIEERHGNNENRTWERNADEEGPIEKVDFLIQKVHDLKAQYHAQSQGPGSEVEKKIGDLMEEHSRYVKEYEFLQGQIAGYEDLCKKMIPETQGAILKKEKRNNVQGQAFAASLGRNVEEDEQIEKLDVLIQQVHELRNEYRSQNRGLGAEVEKKIGDLLEENYRYTKEDEHLQGQLKVYELYNRSMDKMATVVNSNKTAVNASPSVGNRKHAISAGAEC